MNIRWFGLAFAIVPIVGGLVGALVSIGDPWQILTVGLATAGVALMVIGVIAVALVVLPAAMQLSLNLVARLATRGPRDALQPGRDESHAQDDAAPATYPDEQANGFSTSTVSDTPAQGATPAADPASARARHTSLTEPSARY